MTKCKEHPVLMATGTGGKRMAKMTKTTVERTMMVVSGNQI